MDKGLILSRFHNFFKHFRLAFGELGEHFAVEVNLFLFQGGDELAVRKTERSDGGVDFDSPEAAEVALFIAPMIKSVFAGVEQGDLGFALFLGAAEAVALNRAQNAAAVGGGNGSSFDSRHIKLGFRC